jgi:MoaA/NifB/PqqE/SkfB family radical SAM enzyme
MKSFHYDLLRVDGAGLRGPLTLALGEEISRNWKLRLLSPLSRLKPGGLELLGIRAGLGPDGKLQAKPTGLLAKGLGKKIVPAVVKAVADKGEPLLRRDGQMIFTLYQPPIPSAPAMRVLASRMALDRTGRPLPATATLQITTACQADCAHCSAARHRNGDRPELSTEELKSLIRQTEALGVINIVFTGGEPLLRRDIYELISWVNKDEAMVMLFTNGLLLNEGNARRLKEAGLFSLNVSLDSPDPATHNRLRRVERCWERAVAGIEQAKKAGLLCGISTYATPERLHRGEVAAMIELAKRVGADEITIFDVVPTGRLLGENESGLLSEEDKEELCRLEKTVNAGREYPHVITQAHVNGPTGAGCYAGWFQFYATAYGDITPCDFTPLKFGNIREQKLAQIWQNIITHPAYTDHCNHCRMQDGDFRRRWIDPIPAQGPFPHPVASLGERPAGREVVRAEVSV